MPLFSTQYEGPDSIFTVNRPKAKKSIYVKKAEEEERAEEKAQGPVKSVNPVNDKQNYNDFIKKMKVALNGLNTVDKSFTAHGFLRADIPNEAVRLQTLNIVSQVINLESEADALIGSFELDAERVRKIKKLLEPLKQYYNSILDSVNALNGPPPEPNIRFPDEETRADYMRRTLGEREREQARLKESVLRDVNELLTTTAELYDDIKALLQPTEGLKYDKLIAPIAPQDELLGLHEELGAEFGLGAGIRCRSQKRICPKGYKYGGEMNHDLYIDTKYLL
jgi:hypothetical protein